MNTKQVKLIQNRLKALNKEHERLKKEYEQKQRDLAESFRVSVEIQQKLETAINALSKESKQLRKEIEEKESIYRRQTQEVLLLASAIRRILKYREENNQDIDKTFVYMNAFKTLANIVKKKVEAREES